MAEALRIVVTGGSGRIGGWLIRCLLDRGHKVVNVDRQAGDDNGAQFIECDIRQRELIEPILRDSDAVCHLAEIPNSSCPFPKDEIYWSNARSASVVLQAAADLRLRRAVYASSCQVYGSWGQNRVPPLRLPIDESYPVNPRNVYAVSKAANESFAQYVSLEENLGISIVRFPWVVATEEGERHILQYGHSDGPVDDGLATFLHASDLALAIAAAVETCRPGCEVYNLCGPDVVSIVPLRQRLERHHPDFPPLPPGWPDLKSPVSIEKAEKLLGWRPKWTFAAHLRESASRG